jgi:uncharacterized membrane protein
VTTSQRLLAGFFVLAGTMHFVIPRRYEAIMPPYLPRHREAVVVSGAAEIAGGLAVIPGRTRPAAGLWLVAVLAAVFPANVHMAVHPDQIRGLDTDRVRPWMLWARLPLQPLIMAWAWRATRG